ncbi:uncharacterized protein LOC131604488 [Vicia villosa]|uniref:uncharacterized protein LOC131604488 n=1 Tax=Vicia villosa TaxID=3911 RepID=UPI00273B1302|nr:uncharacterized protein LOC131604488 [Vicia villosa]
MTSPTEVTIPEEATSQNPIQLRSSRGKTDIAWAHCKQVEEKGKLVNLCIHCNKIIRGGGINRFKRHLAGITGEVEPCKKVPPDVQYQMKQNLDEVSNKRRKTQAQNLDVDLNTQEGGVEEMDVEQSRPDSVIASQKRKSTSRIGNYFMPRTTPRAQPTLKSVLQNKEVVEKCDLAIARWFIDSSVPFNAANSAYFQSMADALCSMSPGYKVPTMHSLRGFLLNKWVEDVNKLIEEYREIWKKTGCTLMADGWTDRKRRTLINFLVYCPKVTDNAANYVAAGRLLENEFPTLFWSPCAAHCINLMLQDMGKLEEVSEAVSHASNVTKYIYNHCYALYLMRKQTGGREILRPAPTRFATNFIALQIKLTEPLVRVLRIVDSEDKPAMGILYKSIVKARKEMVRRFQRNKKKVDPYLKILDKRWDSQLRKNLHAAGYWLNPACRYNDVEFEKHASITSGLLDVIEKHANGNSELRLKLTDEMRIFKDGELDFGRKSAVDERCIVKAVQISMLAIRILSQTCSASGCERNWSIFEHIHSKKRNRLEHQKLNDLVFVRYNLRLQHRKTRHGSYDPINIETIGDHSSWVLEDSPPLLTNEEVEALRNDLANMTIQPISSDIDQLDLDEDEDGDVGNTQDNTVDNVNQESSNVGEDEPLGEDQEAEDGYEYHDYDNLTPWA